MVDRFVFFDEPQRGAAEEGRGRIIDIAAFRAAPEHAPAAPVQWWARKAEVVSRRQSPLTKAVVLRWPGELKLKTRATD